MSKQTISGKETPRPYFRKHNVPDAPVSTAERKVGSWAIRGATVITAFAMVFSTFVPAHAGNSGAVWTNTGPCGNPQNVNQYAVGEDFYLHISGFIANTTYTWNFKDTGANGAIYHTGTITTDADGSACANLLTLTANDAGGPYNLVVGDQKNDNFKVDTATPTTGTLTLVKALAGDPAPDNVTAWTLSATGATSISGATGSAAVTNAVVTAGSYALAESGPTTNYTASAWSCSNATMADTTHVTVVAGGSATCTITNTYTAPVVHRTGTLIVKKVIVGSNATPDQFSFKVNGGSSIAFEADGQNNITEAAGTYSVTEVADSNYTTTYDNCSDLTLAVDGIQTCTITNTFIAVQNPKYSLSGKVYNDNNTQNGEYDPSSEGSEGEAGLSGWTIKLFTKGDPNVLVGSAETDANGDYSFTNLDAGCYIVSEVLQSGWNETDPTVADDSAQGVVTDGEYQVALGGASCAEVSLLDFFIHTAQAIAINTTVTDLNFGNVQIPTGCTSNCGGGGGGGGTPISNILSGFKYNDANKNGTRDNGETGLSGWVIYLDLNNNGVHDNGEPSQTTDSNGAYSFVNITPNTYVVREVNQSGWTQYEPGAANNNSRTVVVTTTSSITNSNFGNAQGQVLGEVTTTPSTPTPRVAGASTELPRTGMGIAWIIMIGSIAAYAAVSATRKLKVDQE